MVYEPTDLSAMVKPWLTPYWYCVGMVEMPPTPFSMVPPSIWLPASSKMIGVVTTPASPPSTPPSCVIPEARIESLQL